MLQDRRYLAAVLGLQVCFLIAGIVAEFWLMIGFCVASPTPFVSAGLGIIWFGLTVSPLLGFISFAEGFERARFVYFFLALATPVFLFAIWALNNARVLTCDAL